MGRELLRKLNRRKETSDFPFTEIAVFTTDFRKAWNLPKIQRLV